MKAIKADELQNNFKRICEIVDQGETVVIPRPPNQNVILLSESEYNAMLKARKNAEFIERIDKSLEEIAEGKIVIKTLEELEEMTK